MNIIGCLDIPTSGKYILDGVDVSMLSDDELSLMAAISALASCITIDIQNEAKEQLRKIFGEFEEKALDTVTEIIQGANNFINKRQ